MRPDRTRGVRARPHGLPVQRFTDPSHDEDGYPVCLSCGKPRSGAQRDPTEKVGRQFAGWPEVMRTRIRDGKFGSLTPDDLGRGASPATRRYVHVRWTPPDDGLPRRIVYAG